MYHFMNYRLKKEQVASKRAKTFFYSISDFIYCDKQNMDNW